jgi:hypothetical protein
VGKAACYELRQTHTPESSPAVVNLEHKKQTKKPVKVARNRQEEPPKVKNARDFSKVGVLLAINMVTLHVIAVSQPERNQMYDMWNQVHSALNYTIWRTPHVSLNV